MHELSIATSLLDLVEETLLASDAPAASRVNDPTPAVEAVVVRIGPLSGVVPEALASAFLTARGRLESTRRANLEIVRTPLSSWCDACEREVFPPDVQRLICPICAAPTPRVMQGRELELQSLKLRDPASREPTTA